MSEEVKTSKTLSIICFIVSIIGFLTGIIVIGILFDIIAITLGLVAIISMKQRNWLSISGLSISSCGLVLMALFIVFVVNGDTVEKTATAQTEDIEVTEELEVKTEDIEKVAEAEENEVIEESIEDDQEVEEMQHEEFAPIETEENETEVEEELVDYSELSDEEYKELCEQVYYDEIMFSKESSKGKLIKTKLFLAEEMFFNADNIYNLYFVDMMKKYDFDRIFYKACVDREDSDSFVGESIILLFPNDSDYDPSDYDIGNYIIVYGEIIEHSIDNWDGFNECTILPRIIEMSER